MPIFDPEQERLVVRIVYDGPGVAGKTTNVEYLCNSFGGSSASELFDGGRVAERTQFFECMHVDGALISGFRLRSVFATVPGQEELRGRRMALLDIADAVVFVCDSRQAGLPRAREMFEALQRRLEETGRSDLTVILQANKQDLPGALDTAQVRRGLGAPAKLTMVGAQAIAGIGVREAAVLATRGAAERARHLVESKGLSAIESGSMAPEALLAKLQSLPAEGVDNPLLAAVGDLERPSQVGDVSLAPSAGPSITPSAARLPCLEADPKHVWPVIGGTDVAQRLRVAGSPVLRPDLSSNRESGFSTVFEVGSWWARTDPRLRFDSESAAEDRLRSLARMQTRLGDYAPPRSTLCITQSADGGHWIWSLHPALKRFSERLEVGGHAAAEVAREYCKVSFSLLEQALVERLSLDLRPDLTAQAGTRIAYLGFEISGGRARMVSELLECLSECERRWAPGANLLDAFWAFRQQLPPGPAARLTEAMADFTSNDSALESLRQRCLSARCA